MRRLYLIPFLAIILTGCAAQSAPAATAPTATATPEAIATPTPKPSTTADSPGNSTGRVSRADQTNVGKMMLQATFLQEVKSSVPQAATWATDDNLIAAGYAACDAVDAGENSISMAALSAAKVPAFAEDINSIWSLIGSAFTTLCPEHSDYKIDTTIQGGG